MKTSPRTSHALLAAALLALAAAAGCKDAAGPTTGAARVTVTTAGLDLDADGYMVTVDGEPWHAVGRADAVTIPELATGGHTVGLSGVAENCTVGGDNPRPIVNDSVAIYWGARTGKIFRLAK